MKRKNIIGIVLTLILAASFIVAGAFPAIATDPRIRPEKTAYATIGSVALDLPSNATYPAKAGGTPNHPIELRITAFDHSKRSTDGASDQIIVFMWDPRVEQFTPILAITDNPAWAEFIKTLYNNTYIWYPTPLALQPIYGPNLFPNVVVVEPEELEVWSENVGDYGHNDVWSNDNSKVLMVNLTRTVKVTLDSFIINASVPAGPNSARFANATFNLPPMTMIFHEFDDKYPNQETTLLNTWAGASNYTVKETWTEVSSRVEVEITDWTSPSSLEFIGHVDQNSVAKFYPPPA